MGILGNLFLRIVSMSMVLLLAIFYEGIREFGLLKNLGLSRPNSLIPSLLLNNIYFTGVKSPATILHNRNLFAIEILNIQNTIQEGMGMATDY